MLAFKVRSAIPLATLVMVIGLGSACAPGATPAPTPVPEPQPAPTKPLGNQPPVILRLTSSRTQLYPANIAEIRCDASDRDGDAITYTWTATGGRFSGAGPVVSWLAPEHYGAYEITVTVEDDKGGTAQNTVTVNVTANQNPVISSLVADPVAVLPEGRSTITATASDPDGDALNYLWKASDGSVTGVGSTVTWIAPNREGTFTITVTADDGNGGQGMSSVSIAVTLTQKTITLTPVPKETGTVSHSGYKDNSRTVAGDSESNDSYRAFWSFDLHSLRGTDVKDAKLTFTTKDVVGDPFSKIVGLGGLRIWRVRYEPGQLPSFDVPRTQYREMTPTALWEPPTTMDVTQIAGSITRGDSDRLQLAIGFSDEKNGNSVADRVEWSSVTLTITYAEK